MANVDRTKYTKTLSSEVNTRYSYVAVGKTMKILDVTD